MPSRQPPDASDLAPWVEWENIVDRVRAAKSADTAILMMKRHFRSVLGSLDRDRDQKLKRSREQHQRVREWHDRTREMAKAMAGPNREWGAFFERADELDRALQARKKFEI
jgi:hypothetical protein